MTEYPRLDLLISQYGRTIMMALVAVSIVAALLGGYLFVAAATDTETGQVADAEIETQVHTASTVADSGLWSSGTELENQPLYLLEASPDLTVRPETTVPSGGTSVIHEISLVYLAQRDGSRYWEEQEVLQRESATVTDGTATSSVEIDMTQVRDELADITEETRNVGSIGVDLVVTVEYDTGTYSGTQELSTPLSMTDAAYWLEEPQPSDSTTHYETVQLDAGGTPDPVPIAVLAAIAVISLIGAQYVRARPTIDEDLARRKLHERRYSEWISRGTLPMWIGERYIELETLEDVVDVAIDSEKRVVHDERRGLFAVVSDEIVYYYSERGTWEETTWPDMDFGSSGTLPVLRDD